MEDIILFCSIGIIIVILVIIVIFLIRKYFKMDKSYFKDFETIPHKVLKKMFQKDKIKVRKNPLYKENVDRSRMPRGVL